MKYSAQKTSYSADHQLLVASVSHPSPRKAAQNTPFPLQMGGFHKKIDDIRCSYPHV